MTAKRKLTMYCTPTMKKKLQALAKRSGCSMDFFCRGVLSFAIYHFDGKITEVLKLFLQQDAKRTKEKHSVPLTVRLAPEVYEGLQRLHRRTEAAVRAAAPTETSLSAASLLFFDGAFPTEDPSRRREMPRCCIILTFAWDKA